MHKTYISSSSTIGFRSKGCVYYSLNENNNSSCTCWAFPFHVSPRCLYGLKQSTLIHCSASRRLILGVRSPCFRLPLLSGLETGGLSRSGHGVASKKTGRVGCMVWEDINYDLGIEDTAEAMLSLLTEQVDKIGVVGRRNGKAWGRGVKTENTSRKYVNCDCSKRIAKEKLENAKAREEDKYVESRNSEEYRWSASFEGGQNQNDGFSKRGSNSSSYYSAFSSDDFDESDVDFQVKHQRLMGESSNNKDKNRRDGVSVDSVRKQSQKYQDDVNQDVTIRRSSAAAFDSNWCKRNEREKKHTHLSVPQPQSRKQSPQKFSNFLDIHESNSETLTPWNQFSVREENSTSSLETVGKTSDRFRQTGDLVIQHAGSRRTSHEFTEQSDTRGSEIHRESSSLTRFGERDEKLTASVNFNQKAREKQRLKSPSGNRKYESTMKSQQLTRTSKTHGSDIERTPTSQQLSGIRLPTNDKSSTLFVQAKEKQFQTDEQTVGRTVSKKNSQDLTNIPVTYVSDTVIATDTQKLLETRKSFEEKNSASRLDSVEEAREGQSVASKGAIEKGVRNEEPQSRIKLSGFPESSARKSSSSQASFSLVQQAAEMRVNEKKKNRGSSAVIMTPPPSQFVKRTSQGSSRDQKPSSIYAIPEVSCATWGNGSTSLSTEEKTPDFSSELDAGTRKDNMHVEHSELMFNEDALGSANRLEESSTQFVGEFSEKLSHEVLTSMQLEGTTSCQTASTHKDEKYTQQASSQRVSDDFHSSVHGLKRSSFGSGARGPGDEMWDVAGPSSQEPTRIEAPGEVTSSTGSAIIKNSRSLWSIIGDIIRMRWGAHSENHKSAIKSGVKTSSNESMESETWFSSHDPDEKDDEYSKKGKRGLPRAGIAADNRMIQIETDKFSSCTIESSSYKDTSSASREENIGQKDVKRDQTSPSRISTADSSLPLSSRRLIRSPPLIEEIHEIDKAEASSSGLRFPSLIEEIPENDKAEASSSGLMEMAESVRESPSEASGTEAKDGELKRRKLQRNKQVLRERFEEWEEAYRLESEQRKIDEMFMREALLEAKRAADTWEVPVGAVLVKHGKIIARGCNLVEELRDSTAHAEMICIREASNSLRTWRLAETTLYVTLEPCAMCAGAILQARIDTVVWGAPNKLLGADGSWVRLFPNGGEGESGSDLTNQPAGPVHPFHPKMTVRRGILSTECAEVMQQFFQLRRKKEKKHSSPPTSCLPISNHPSKFISKMHDIFSIMFCM